MGEVSFRMTMLPDNLFYFSKIYIGKHPRGRGYPSGEDQTLDMGVSFLN